MAFEIDRRMAMGAAGGAFLASGPALGAGPPGLVERYVAAWEARDLTAICACMAPTVSFIGPNVSASDQRGYERSTARFLRLVERVKARAVLQRGDAAMIAWDFGCVAPIGVSAVAELVRIEGGLIVSDEIFFDTAPFATLSRPGAAGGARVP